MLAEEGSQIRQHAARHHHLLAEEQGGIQEKAVLLDLPKQIGFEIQEGKGHHGQRPQPQNNRFQFFHSDNQSWFKYARKGTKSFGYNTCREQKKRAFRAFCLAEMPKTTPNRL